MTSPAAAWMVIGRIVGAFGLRGEVKVEMLTDFPDRFGALSAVFVGGELSEIELRGARRHKNLILLRLAGVDTPEAADALRGQEIFIPRSESVSLKEDEFFIEDVIGIEAQSETGQVIGRISDVVRTGSNDVFVLRGQNGEILVPATKDAVPSLDVSGRSMVVALWVLQEPL